MSTRHRTYATLCCGRRSVVAILALAGVAGGLWGQAPQGVSPGSPAVAQPLADSCPAFSWTQATEAKGYELALYRVAESGVLETVHHTRMPGGASSWTPPAAGCPQSGGEYAWAVRALDDDGQGPWSALMLFATPAKPTDDDVRQALEVLRRHQDTGSQPAGGETSTTLPSPIGSEREGLVERRAEHAMSGALLRPRALSAPTAAPTPAAPTVTPPASFSLSLDGDVELGGFLFKEGYSFIHTDGGVNYFNTAVGLGALESVTLGSPYSGYSGSRNTALGFGALRNNTAGVRNTVSGYKALLSNTTGTNNTGTGAVALGSNTTGSYNTATGSGALFLNTTGSHNTATGFGALLSHTTGSYNTATGRDALRLDTTGSDNTASGSRALFSNSTGFQNTASGVEALKDNSTGDKNTAAGFRALLSNTSGRNNTGIGYRAGADWTTGHNNIALGIGSDGAAGESGVIRIGGDDRQTQTFIEGISGTNVSGVNVLITANDQLGVAASSARFKQDIHELDGVTDRLRELRPVSFRYKDEFAAGSLNSFEYGLIAEEVAEVFPELVVRDAEGKPYTVRYHLLTPLLLAEIQRQDRELGGLRSLRQEVADLRLRLTGISRTIKDSAPEQFSRLPGTRQE